MSSNKRPLSEISSNLPTSPSKIRNKKARLPVSEKDRLEVFNLAPASVEALVDSWVNPPAVFKKTNASLPSVVLPAGLDRLKFMVPEALDWGPCRVLSTRTQDKVGMITVVEKVAEGGSNNDSPRVGGPDKKKYYAYHLVALSAARAEDMSVPASFSLVSAAAAAGVGVGGPSSGAFGLDEGAKIAG